ncbi:Abhydrolase-3 domain-containing protein [Mycena chlorophos]|uniref:Abhydrolase-3 domain-containing protein n=1 Tax=Mycena chlorophos TaxID=658473 RepID=A0A8H6STA8_MYCCL|nr:Abhydrolase-3 domain-containing protein [Mycena chlorophos]
MPVATYGQLPPLMQVVGMLPTVLLLPPILVWAALFTSHASRNKDKSLKRIIGERAMRYAFGNFTIPQLQFAFGTTGVVYDKWTKQTKQAPMVDDLDDGAKLYWVGPKRTDRVLLFLHGGCFVLPINDFTLDFLRHVQLELEKQKIEVGIAVLEYSLAPYAQFPTPLKQASHAVDFLYSTGLKPGNQMLHPVDGVSNIRPPTGPIGGICCLSPWASLTTDAKSASEFDGIDVIPLKVVGKLGRELLAAYPETESARAFAEPAKASAEWFAGSERVVSRVLITCGGTECMRDDIVQLGELLKRQHSQTEVVVQNGGVHDDMLIDFMVKETKLGELTPLVISWLAKGWA